MKRTNKPTFFIIYLFTLGICILIPQAFGKGKTAAPTPEVYSAIEGTPEFLTQTMTPLDATIYAVEIEKTGGTPTVSAPDTASKKSSKKSTAKGTAQKTIEALETRISELESQLAIQRAPAPQEGGDKWTYEPVPDDKKAQLAERMKLIEKLVTKHSRAYDYRVHTNKELSNVLDQLDGAAR